MSEAADEHVALLRGINVGGRNVIKMVELRQMMEACGHRHVRTYIQSGNILFEPAAPEATPTELSTELAAAILDSFGVSTVVVLRTIEEMEAAVAVNPFADREPDPKNVHVVFLERAPTDEATAKLDPNHSPPDEFTLVGREMYWWLPSGAAKSKLTLDYFEPKLEVRGTARNLRTTSRIIDLSRS